MTPFLLIPPLVICFLLLMRAEGRAPRDVAAVRIWKPACTVLCMLMCGLSLTQPGGDPLYTALVFAGLVFCLMGDVLLIPRHDPKKFMYGLVSFLIGHVIFIAAFIAAQNAIGLPDSPTREAIAAAALLALAGAVFFYLRPGLGKMQIPVMVYMAVISLMVHRAVGGLYVGAGAPLQPVVAMAGALLFYISDFVLAVDRFAFEGELPGANWMVLGAYFSAIALIALSASFVRA
jgi:uncharacterized membrane protein YhhN